MAELLSKPFYRVAKSLLPHAKRVYSFKEGGADDATLLGLKGANLCEMSRVGLPVPNGFVITTDACAEFLAQPDPRALSDEILSQINNHIRTLERSTGRYFGVDAKDKPRSLTTFPLLLSVRASVATADMPGLMGTILNLGLNPDVLDVIIRVTCNPRFGYDLYRRFLQMWGTVILGFDPADYERVLAETMSRKGVASEADLDLSALQEICSTYRSSTPVPDCPWVQLRLAVECAFASFNSGPAVAYRSRCDDVDVHSAACVVQAMVYGNLSNRSGSGVLFSRNPSTGGEMLGEYLANAEGEDIISGLRTPAPLGELRNEQPVVFTALVNHMRALERHFKDMQDIEFVVENGELFILQSRPGKRTPKAAIKIAVDLVREGLINERDALLRLDATSMNHYMRPTIDPAEDYQLELCSAFFARGCGASAGAAVGQAAFSRTQAERLLANGTNVILFCKETTDDDLELLQRVDGVVTFRGGNASHAAISCRDMDKSCVVGITGLRFETTGPQETVVAAFNSNDSKLGCGDTITIDGETGLVYCGSLPIVPAGSNEYFQTILSWADRYKRMSVRATAATYNDLRVAREIGCDGLGLLQTSPLLLAPDRIDFVHKIDIMRDVLLSTVLSTSSLNGKDDERRQVALQKALPMMRDELSRIFRCFDKQRVCVQLADPYGHRFLPDPRKEGYETEITSLARRLSMDRDECKAKVRAAWETSACMGLRGVRLGIVHPEIYETQVRAIVEAAHEVEKDGVSMKVQICLPCVSSDHELDVLSPRIEATAAAVSAAEGRVGGDILKVALGVVLETPRACIRADAICAHKEVSFVLIATDSLTQFCYGMAKEDTRLFMPEYTAQHVVPCDPFKTFDQRGVGFLVNTAIAKIRAANAAVKIGICGDHTADVPSIHHFDSLGASFISVSPKFIPCAKVAAAQSAIEQRRRRENRAREEFWQLANLF